MRKFLKQIKIWLQVIGDWPTNKVKGSVAVALLVGIGGFWLRGVIDPGSATERSETLTTQAANGDRFFQFKIDELFDPEVDLDHIDREIFFVDHERRFYLRTPKLRASKITHSEYPDEFDGLSVGTMPFFNLLLDGIGDLAQSEDALPGDVITTQFLAGEKLDLTMDTQTLMGTTPLDYNPLKSLNLGEDEAHLWLKFAGKGEGDIKAREEVFDNLVAFPGIHAMAERGIDEVLSSRLPTTLHLHQGLTIRSYRKSWLLSSPLGRARLGKPSTFTFFFLLQMRNPELAILALNQIDVSENNEAILFDSSFPLRNVVINGNRRDAVEAVKVFLLAEGREYIHVVRLEYLNGLLSRTAEQQLEGSFRSFRVSTR